MTKFLTLKHWQLFLILIGFPMILQFIAIGLAIGSRGYPWNGFIILFPIVMLLYTGLFFIWFYSLGTNLFKRLPVLPVTEKMSLTKFKTFLFIPAAYIIIFCVFIFGMLANLSAGRSPNPLIFAFIVPLHLFCMFCIFYCLYFNAKALKTVELQKPVTFSDFAGEFFLLWFFPIGIWIVQPRINAIFQNASPGI